jgi:hypothetical protein
MVAKILVTEQDGTPKQISFAKHSVLSPTAANELRATTDGSNETDVELELLNLADGNARQSAKVDLGANRAAEYTCRAAIEMQVAAATAGGEIEFYWSPSPSGTVGVGNSGGCSGADQAYTGYSADKDQSIQQLFFIGSMIMTDDGVDSLQIAEVGILRTTQRYGSLVIYNKCGQTICDTDAIESQIVLDPIIPESQ